MSTSAPTPVRSSADDDFITIYDLIAFAWKYRLILVIGTVLGIAAGLGMSVLKATGYTSDASVDVSGSGVVVNQDSKTLNGYLGSAFARVPLSRALAEATLKNLSAAGPDAARSVEALGAALGAKPDQVAVALANHLRSTTAGLARAGTPPKARFAIYAEVVSPDQLKVSVTMPTPGTGSAIATAIAGALPEFLGSYNAIESEHRTAAADPSTRPISEALLNHQRATMRLVVDMVKFSKDLAAAAPAAKPIGLEANISGMVVQDSLIIRTLEVDQLRKRLAAAMDGMSEESYKSFEDRLVNIAARNRTLAALVSSVVPSAAPPANASSSTSGLSPLDPAAYALPAPDKDADATSLVLPGGSDAHTTRRALFAMLGLFAGAFASVFVAMAVQVAIRAREEIGRSRFA